MSDLDLILKAVEFIEAHLTEEITVADMAESVSFSLYHFSRTFSRVTRHTPYDYLMRRRLCEAARCLAESDEKIIDIVFKYQFNAPETFSRAFKRVFKLQPRQVKLQHRFDHRRYMTKLTPQYLDFLNSGATLTPVVQKIPTRQIAGIATQIDTLDTSSVALGVWNMLAQEIQSGQLACHQRDYCGVMMFLPAYSTASANQYMYLAGTSLQAGEQAPPFFVQKNIPAGDYVCFELPERANAVSLTRNYVYHTWWPKAMNSPLAMFEIECFSDQLDGRSRAMGGSFPKSLCFPLAVE